MKLDWKLVLLVTLSLGLMVSCESDDEEMGTFEDLSATMLSLGKDLPTMLDPIGGYSWVVSAASVQDPDDATAVAGFTVLDIRADTAFARGHIKDAINTNLTDILTVASENTGPFLVVCYTGQSAGHGVMALRLTGYEASVLKWGFSGWNSAFSQKWDNNAGHENGNKIEGVDNWVYDASPSIGSYEYPDWESEDTEGEAILATRIQSTLEAGFKSASATGLLGDPASMQIINYWGEPHYTEFGHFNGAIQYNTITLAEDMVKAIDADVETAIYCYTGQTSSMVTFWLNVLGYNAKSVGFGVNTLNFDAMETSFEGTTNYKKLWHGSADFPYVTN